MKNNSGISLITLLITVIVILLIASITTYNGINMINDTRKKDSIDKLKIISNSIVRDDSFLDLEDSSEIELTSGDFDYMDLLKYYDEKYPVSIKKSETTDESGNQIINYELKMTNTKNSAEYSYSFEYIIYNDTKNYYAIFDESNGVNRPIITETMTPLMPDGVTPVTDVYKSSWYSYKKSNPIFAKMSYDGKTYLWIPRFAYKIQEFYNGRTSKDVPSSAISIIFLREDTKYMPNNETLQQGYVLHPAFSKDGVEYSGIWVEQKASDSKVGISSIPEFNSDEIAQMMTNEEFGAAIYLDYAFESNQFEFDLNEFVTISEDAFVSGDSYEYYGDATLETPWDRQTGDLPTSSSEYILRLFEDGMFDFKVPNDSEQGVYRTSVKIK